MSILAGLSTTRLLVLLILCMQNSIFTILRRYSQGILKENYSKYELLLLGEIIKILFSVRMISSLLGNGGGSDAVANHENKSSPSSTPRITNRISHLIKKSTKMAFLALIYGLMNILSFVSLRNIGAGMFTIFAQCKILTTASFSKLMLDRQYSWTRWRALISLSLGVLLFSESVWNIHNPSAIASSSLPHISMPDDDDDDAVRRHRRQLTLFFSPSLSSEGNAFVGILAVVIEVSLSGFASIYFEKVIKVDPEKLNIWERNFQLAIWSVPVYIAFILWEGGGDVGYFGGWSYLAWILSCLGAAGGLLVALSIKYGDSILKTLATTGAIVLSAVLDHVLMGGPLTPIMMLAGCQVILAICNYTFDATPPPPPKSTTAVAVTNVALEKKESIPINSITTSTSTVVSGAMESKDSETKV